MGDELALEDKAQICIALPASALVRIIRDGAFLAEGVGKRIILPIEKSGVYRVEAYLKRYGKYRPWIFSNPIFVKQ